MIRNITDEILFHKKEVQNLRVEKESLEGILAEKSMKVRDTLQSEAQRVEEELKKNL